MCDNSLACLATSSHPLGIVALEYCLISEIIFGISFLLLFYLGFVKASLISDDAWLRVSYLARLKLTDFVIYVKIPNEKIIIVIVNYCFFKLLCIVPE